jgi:hypothetical protein
MDKSHINQETSYFDKYINAVPDVTLDDALTEYGPLSLSKEIDFLTSIGDYVYAEGKWTIKQIIQHLIDTERIFQYRALRFARRDNTVLPGFDEESFAREADVSKRNIIDLLSDYHDLRLSTKSMFASFTNEDLQSKGQAFNSNISVLSIGYIIAGHSIHHMNIIKERYIKA